MELSVEHKRLDSADASERSLFRVPDFIIIGAMKSGTTTLHHLLGQHPDIYIPEGELHFFSIDDLEAFPQAHWDDHWVEQDFDKYFSTYAAWYDRHFLAARPGQITGEDSATYLSSRIAIDRIAKYAPAAKLIVLLRDPVARTYSHYWHWVRTGRAVYSFEDTIRFDHGNLLQRSYYEQHLRYCFEHFPREQIKVLIFENFIKDQPRFLGEILEFLNVPPGENIEVGCYANKGSYPRFLRLKWLENYFYRHAFGVLYSSRIPRLQAPSPQKPSSRIARKLLRILNPPTFQRPRSMDPATQKWLSGWLRRHNEGLPDLLGIDLAEHWPTFAIN